MQRADLCSNKVTVIGAGAALQVPLHSWWRELATDRTYVCVRKGLDGAGRWRVCHFLEVGYSEPFEWDFDALSEAVASGAVVRVAK